MRTQSIHRVCALALMGVTSALAGPAEADPAVERRVAALRALLAHPAPEGSLPTPRRRAAYPRRPAAAALSDDPCERGAWSRSASARRERVRRAIRDAGLRYGVERRLIRSVIRHESNFDVHAVSHRGAQGLMQLMPATARALGVGCPFDPRENILAGTRYLRELYDRFGTWRMALMAYNAGPTRVAAGRIPKETQVYARRVLHSWRPARYPRGRG